MKVTKRLTRASVTELNSSFRTRYGYDLDTELDVPLSLALTIDLDSETITMKERTFMPVIKPTDDLASKPNPIGFFNEPESVQIKFNDGSEFNLTLNHFMLQVGVVNVRYLKTPIPYTIETTSGLVTLLCIVGFSDVGNRVLIYAPNSAKYYGKAPISKTDTIQVDKLEFSFTRSLHASLEYYKSKSLKALLSPPQAAVSPLAKQVNDNFYAPADKEYEPGFVHDNEQGDEASELTSISQKSHDMGNGKKLILEVTTEMKEVVTQPVAGFNRARKTEFDRIPSFSDVYKRIQAGEEVAPLSLGTTRKEFERKRSHTLASRVRRLRLDNTTVVSEDSDMAFL